MRRYVFLVACVLLISACDQAAKEPTLNLPLAQKFSRLMAIDQRARMYLDSVGTAMGMESEAYQHAIERMKITDAENLQAVSHLLDSCGWLGAEVLGEDGHTDLFLAIQHADTSAMVKYLPVLRKAVANKIAEPSNLALMEDRVNVSRNLPQRYGSQLHFVSQEVGYQLYPLQDSVQVDQWRAAMQLEPLADYVAKWKVVWPPKVDGR